MDTIANMPAGAKIAKPLPADTVLRHGTILTVDSRDHVVQALAIRGGRIVALGTDEVMASYIGPKTRVIDLAGRTATPGMIDAHAHALEAGINDVANLQLHDTTSIDQFLAQVRVRAAQLPKPEFDSGDHLHPSDKGHQAMGNGIDLSLFP